ncbi:MAG: hypothetical protein ACE5F9_07630 [Phycisphaerae bacterium]
MAGFEISRPAGRCDLCDRALGEGESFHSALFETDVGFERRDIGEECWTGPPEGVFCHFRTRLPKKAERRKVFVDDGVLVDFFLRLGASDQPSKLRFRFVLALMLMRKRLLRYEETLRDERGETWRMRLSRDKTRHDVFNPVLDEEQVRDLTAELGAILAGGADVEPTAEDTHASETAPPASPPRPAEAVEE